MGAFAERRILKFEEKFEENLALPALLYQRVGSFFSRVICRAPSTLM